MGDTDRDLVSTPEDPRLHGMGQEDVAGADQIMAMLAATPDERLDQLIALVEFVDDGRQAIRHAR